MVVQSELRSTLFFKKKKLQKIELGPTIMRENGFGTGWVGFRYTRLGR